MSDHLGEGSSEKNCCWWLTLRTTQIWTITQYKLLILLGSNHLLSNDACLSYIATIFNQVHSSLKLPNLIKLSQSVTAQIFYKTLIMYSCWIQSDPVIWLSSTKFSYVWLIKCSILVQVVTLGLYKDPGVVQTEKVLRDKFHERLYRPPQDGNNWPEQRMCCDIYNLAENRYWCFLLSCNIQESGSSWRVTVNAEYAWFSLDATGEITCCWKHSPK